MPIKSQGQMRPCIKIISCELVENAIIKHIIDPLYLCLLQGGNLQLQDR